MYLDYGLGYIEVITGGMFAGKSEELIRRVTVLSYANLSILVVKPSVDTRYSETEVVTHSGNRIDSVAVKDSKELADYLYEIGKKGEHIDVVAIDEVQFFDNGIVELVNQLADNYVRVIVAGLDLDFKGSPFGPMPELLASAEFVTKLSAVCSKCGRSATRSQRLIDGKPVPADSDVVQLGATESYEARCRQCHEVL